MIIAYNQICKNGSEGETGVPRALSFLAGQLKFGYNTIKAHRVL